MKNLKNAIVEPYDIKKQDVINTKPQKLKYRRSFEKLVWRCVLFAIFGVVIMIVPGFSAAMHQNPQTCEVDVNKDLPYDAEWNTPMQVTVHFHNITENTIISVRFDNGNRSSGSSFWDGYMYRFIEDGTTLFVFTLEPSDRISRLMQQ